LIDGSYAKAHQHSAGAAGPDPQAIGKSLTGHTSKIHLTVDAYGLPIDFTITGARFTMQEAPALLAHLLGEGAFVAVQAITARIYATRSKRKRVVLSFRENATLSRATPISLAGCIAIAIWWRTCLPG
jgi:hypothetical protein